MIIYYTKEILKEIALVSGMGIVLWTFYRTHLSKLPPIPDILKYKILYAVGKGRSFHDPAYIEKIKRNKKK